MRCKNNTISHHQTPLDIVVMIHRKKTPLEVENVASPTVTGYGFCCFCWAMAIVVHNQLILPGIKNHASHYIKSSYIVILCKRKCGYVVLTFSRNLENLWENSRVSIFHQLQDANVFEYLLRFDLR